MEYQRCLIAQYSEHQHSLTGSLQQINGSKIWDGQDFCKKQTKTKKQSDAQETSDQQSSRLASASAQYNQDLYSRKKTLPLPLGVWEGLQFVIVALPGLFSYLFFSHEIRDHIQENI